MKTRLLLSLLVLLWGSAVQAEPAPEFDLPALEALARDGNRSLQASRDQVAAAAQGVRAAAAFPNPEVEYLSGQSTARAPGVATGELRSLSLTQPLDFPWRRAPRIALAEAQLAGSEAEARGFEADVLARVRLRYFELLRREAEMRNARDDARVTEGVRSRIALRVESGEAPRFELIKAEAEAMNAQKIAQGAAFRVAQARQLLRQAIGVELPQEFALKGHLKDVPALDTETVLHAQLETHSPDLARARTEVVRAERQLAVERAARSPSVALRATRDEDAELRSSRLGVLVTIPLWDRRGAQVKEAELQLSRSRHLLDAQGFALSQSLRVAVQQYEIAQTQILALESGIVRQAENALKVAEAAYRFGERGFIEVLDAQRVFRAARSELIAARYELAAAWVEIERLRALPAGVSE